MTAAVDTSECKAGLGGGAETDSGIFDTGAGSTAGACGFTFGPEIGGGTTKGLSIGATATALATAVSSENATAMFGSTGFVPEPFPFQNSFTETAATRCNASETPSAMRNAPLHRPGWNSRRLDEDVGIAWVDVGLEPGGQRDAE